MHVHGECSEYQNAGAGQDRQSVWDGGRLCVSLNGQYILCFLDHLSHITVQWNSFNF